MRTGIETFEERVGAFGQRAAGVVLFGAAALSVWYVVHQVTHPDRRDATWMPIVVAASLPWVTWTSVRLLTGRLEKGHLLPPWLLVAFGLLVLGGTVYLAVTSSVGHSGKSIYGGAMAGIAAVVVGVHRWRRAA